MNPEFVEMLSALSAAGAEFLVVGEASASASSVARTSSGTSSRRGAPRTCWTSSPSGSERVEPRPVQERPDAMKEDDALPGDAVRASLRPDVAGPADRRRGLRVASGTGRRGGDRGRDDVLRRR